MGEARRKKADLLSIADRMSQTNYGERKIIETGKVTIEFFPEGYQALNRELATGFHPRLEAILAESPVDEVDEKIANICTYCMVAIDGVYDLAQRDKLCFILAGRLEAMREVPAAQTIITMN